MLHKVEKALMLETDVPETPNEMIFLAQAIVSAFVLWFLHEWYEF